jgi:hypothetical protein
MARATRNYLNNANILEELRKSKQQGAMTKEFTKMMILLCDRYASSGKFSSYTYNEDMRSHALENICKKWKSFDETVSQNPFSYYTQTILNSFRQYLNTEKSHRNIRDSILVNTGLDPSFTYSIDSAEMYNNGTYNPDNLIFTYEEPTEAVK